MCEVRNQQRPDFLLRLDHRIDRIFVFVDETEGLRVVGSRMDENGAVHAVFDLAAEVRVVPMATVLGCCPLVTEALAGQDGTLGYAWDTI